MKEDEAGGQRMGQDNVAARIFFPKGGERTAMGCSTNGDERWEKYLVFHIIGASRAWEKLSLEPWRW